MTSNYSAGKLGATKMAPGIEPGALYVGEPIGE